MKITKYTVSTPTRSGEENRKEPMTLTELIKYFGYTLEVGNSWNKKIQRSPKTIASFIKHYNMAVDEQYGACYYRPYITLCKTVKADIETVVNQ